MASKGQSKKRFFLIPAIFIVVVVLVVSWLGKLFVFADIDLERVYIFPTSVISEGWINERGILLQDVSGQGSVYDFTKENSAYVLVEGEPIEENVEQIEEQIQEQIVEQLPIETESTETVTVESKPVDTVPVEVEPTEIAPIETVVENTEPIEQIASPSVDLLTEETGVSDSAIDEDVVVEENSTEETDVSDTVVESESGVASEVIDEPIGVEVIEEFAEESAQKPEQEPIKEVPEEITEEVIIEPTDTLIDTSTDESARSSVDDNIVATSSQTDVVGDTQTVSSASFFKNFASNLSNSIAIHRALASTTDEIVTSVTTSTTPVLDEPEPKQNSQPVNEKKTDVLSADDVSTCKILQKECHTLSLGSFVVDGPLTEKRLKQVHLNFSMASLGIENDAQDDRLVVRYNQNGAWKTAGEIYLNTVIANNTNGGYFTYKIDDIDKWEDLKNLAVIIEYDKLNKGKGEIYLDSLWLEVLYENKGYTDKTVTPADMSANVVTQLNSQALIGGSIPSVNSNKIVHFEYTDDTKDETFLFSSDVEFAGSSDESASYVSLTNSTDKQQEFILQVYSKNTNSQTVIKQWMHGVPNQTQVVKYATLSYFCEDGWISQTAVSSVLEENNNAKQNTCVPTGETKFCTSFNDDKTSCIVENDVLSVTDKNDYKSEWRELTIATGSIFDDALFDDTIGYKELGWGVGVLRKPVPKLYSVKHHVNEVLQIGAGQTLYFAISNLSNIDEPNTNDTNKSSAISDFYIEAVGRSEAYGLLGTLGKTKNETSLNDKEKSLLKENEINETLIAPKDAKLSEDLEFHFRYTSPKNIFSKMLKKMRGKSGYVVRDVELIHESGKVYVVPVEINYDTDGLWSLSLKNNERQFSPGKYKLKLSIDDDGDVHDEEQVFYWGVLAVNTNKTIYKPNEEAELNFATLADTGHTICDADLRLEVRTPTGDTLNPAVYTSNECGPNNVTDVPDYTAYIVTDAVGVYNLSVSHFDNSGVLLHKIADSFEVRDTVLFDIERVGPTRIYPLADYPMFISVQSKDGFIGTVTESMPRGFEVVSSNGGSIQTLADKKIISWDVNLEPGEIHDLTYTFDAPDISPYLFLSGPLLLEDNSKTEVFRELREWQIASDALGSMLAFWDGPGVPSGWSCVSCSPGDAFYDRFVKGATAYGGTGGTATTTHTANFVSSSNSAGTVSARSRTDTAYASAVHAHNSLQAGSSATAVETLPALRTLKVIRSNTPGEPTNLPTGIIGIFDASVPSGWSAYASQNNKFAQGSTTPGLLYGADTHTHPVNITTGSPSLTNTSRDKNATVAATDTHTHSGSDTTDSISNMPAYIEVVYGTLDATSTPPNALIMMWDDTPDTGWNSVSGAGQDFNGQFIRGSATYNASSQGGASHAHGNQTIATGGASASFDTESGSSYDLATAGHTHDITVSFTSNNHEPPYREVVFAKRLANVSLYTQTSYRWYANVNAITPTDAWPAGASDLAEDTAILSTNAPPGPGDVVRMRLSVLVENSTSTAESVQFKLQYGEGSTCSTITEWFEVGAIASTTVWRGYNNASVADGDTLATTTLTVADVFESYEEENNSTSTPNEIGVGADGEWDWVVENYNATSSTQYCFRMANSDETALDGYDIYPQLITNASPNAPTLSKLFDNEQVASTSPHFEFFTTDIQNESLDYQIQIDDDYNFGSVNVDQNSSSNPTSFSNLTNPPDKEPFNSGDTIRFITPTALTNNTTYWWRVRARDPNGSNEWGVYSVKRSFRINTSTIISTWYQTTEEQFDTDTLDGLDSLVTDEVELLSGSTTGQIISSYIDFDWKTTGTAWGELSWNDTEPPGDILYQLQYFTSTSSWAIIPDADLAGNSSGFDVSPINLLGLNNDIYTRIRIIGNFTDIAGTPTLHDWTLKWGLRVDTPTSLKLFDNEKTATTTPSFEFFTTDPDGDDLTYEISWSTDYNFITASTTVDSEFDLGFVNIASSTDFDPFVSGDTIRFTIQSGDALTNGTTYWWRVRAKDPLGGDAYSFWSDRRSFTVDTSIIVPTWFQTTNEQFDTDTLNGTETFNNQVRVATSTKEALIAYGEGTVQTPRFRTWDGSAWSSEDSALDVGAPINWVVTRAGSTRNEYITGTLGTDGDVNVQVYTNSTASWDSLQELTSVVSSIDMRAFDIAYETNSGNALAVTCDGDADPTYRIWDGTSWSGPASINLSSANNCEWIKLASDPDINSNEIILVARDTGSQYEAQVWDGSAWGNAVTQGSMQEVSHEGIAVAYEDSGNQAVIVTSNFDNKKMQWRAWDGASWTGIGEQNLEDDFEWGTLASDDGTDNMVLCYVSDGGPIGTIRWTGSGWAGNTTIESTGNSVNDRAVDCVYEVSSGRDGYAMVPYSDTTNARYQFWNGTVWSSEASVSSIEDSATVQTQRSGDGKILAVFFDDTNTQYDFSYWNGSVWSSAQTLEDTPSVTGAPFKEPFMMAMRNPATIGKVKSTAIDFDDGLSPFWEEVSWNATVPGASTFLIQVEYFATTGAWALIPDSDLAGNSVGTSTSPFSIRDLNTTTYNQIRLVANFTCDSGNCPTLDDWTIKWAEGLTVSGTAHLYDQVASTTSGTVAVAVNGLLQSGKTSAIVNGDWSIPNVTIFSGDVITVFIDGAVDASEASAVTVYDGNGDVDGLKLYERHLSLGSSDNPTITNSVISDYDNSVSGDEDIFFNVTAGNDLTACVLAGCDDVEIIILANTIYRPDNTSGGNVTTNDIEILGTLTADGNIITASGSWVNTGTFNANTSSVILSATSTTEVVNSTGAVLGSFNVLTFGQGSGSAIWTLQSALDVNDNLSINFGTLSQGSYNINVAGNLSIGAGGLFSKGSATTTFDGSVTKTWNDASTPKQDMGVVVINGSSKIVNLASNVALTNLTISGDDTLNVTSSNYTIDVYGNWTNNNTFVANQGLVAFATTSPGLIVTPGSSSFYDISFTGVGGGWSFGGAHATTTRNVTIASGNVTLPTGAISVGGSLINTAGTIVHNDGLVKFTSTTVGKSVTLGGSDLYDTSFLGVGGEWTFTDINATTTNDLLFTAGNVIMPSGTLAIGGSLTTSAGTFAHNSGNIRFNSSASETISTGASVFYDITFDNAIGDWAFTQNNATSSNDVNVVNGTLTNPSGIFAIGGSLTNTDSFVHNNGIVKFDSADTGETINTGSSSFANVEFISVGGGWSVTNNATSTGYLSLLDATGFTVNSGVSVEVGGLFTNNIGASSTWSGSTLFLNSGIAQSINSKTTAVEAYENLLIGTDTRVSMWNSSAVSVVTYASSSLYAQDYAGVNGDLYIFGEYERTSGSDYWSYNTDFDGIDISGSPRQVSVLVADGSFINFAGGSLNIIGVSSASTTITNQGSGNYSLSVNGGVFNANYYDIQNTNISGLQLLGGVSVTSLDDGVFTLDVDGGTMMSVASTTIDANPSKQIQRVSFSTSTGIASGFNVTGIDLPVSTWRFKNHYGNYDGENYDSDPGGNPGSIVWDDSGYDISVSGKVFSDHGITPLGAPTCDGALPVVTLKINGTTTYTTSCSIIDGSFSFPSVQFSGNPVITIFLDSNGAERSALVTKGTIGNLVGMDLYQNVVTLRHEDVEPITIADITVYDSDQDTDLPFDAEVGSPNTLVTQADTELHIATGKTFVPGGNVTLTGGGSGSITDGRLHLATSSTLTMTGAPLYSIGGGLLIENSAVFSSASSTISFIATTTGHAISASSTIVVHDAVFNGSGGAWSLNDNMTVDGTIAITAGTLSGDGNLTVNTGTLAGAGTLDFSGGTVTLKQIGTFGGSVPWAFNNLTFGDGALNATTTALNTATTTVRGVMTILANHELKAGNQEWRFVNGGTPFVPSGTFDAQTSLFYFSATTSTSIADTTYNNLTLAPNGAGVPTFTLQGGILDVNNLTIGDGVWSVNTTANTLDPSIQINDDVLINNFATLVASNVGSFVVDGSWTNLGTFTNSGGGVTFSSADTGEAVTSGGSSFGDIEFNNTNGGWTIIDNATSTGDWTLTNANSFTVNNTVAVDVGGLFSNLVGGASTTWTGSSLYLTSGSAGSINTKSVNGDLYETLIIGANTDIRMWNSSSTVTSVNASGSLYSQDHNAINGDLYIYGDYIRSSGSDYWSYNTDFDGTDITGSPRVVSVKIATSSAVTLSGGILDILGAAGATTTITNQGVGGFALNVSGGTLNAQYYSLRDVNQSGLSMTGSPTITSISNGDFEPAYDNASMISLAASVINANPLKTFVANRFDQPGGINGTFNVKVTGTPVSSWRFNGHVGNRDGEAHDSDPGGDPGYVRWDDSATDITISGNVYADEASTVSSACDDSTPVVHLRVGGTVSHTTFCASSDGAYSIPGVFYVPGDTLTLYLDTNGAESAANVSVDPVTNISDMNLYENRVVLRHEDTNPLRISDIEVYDSDDDTDVPFDAVLGSPNTLLVSSNHKVIIWDSKTFAPGGNVTIAGNGLASALDGTLDLQANAVFSAQGTETHTFAGSWLFASGASFTPASSLIVLNATTTGKTLSSLGSSFYNLTFNGTGGDWTMTDANATTTNDFTISVGGVTLPSGVLAVGSSFVNTSGSFVNSSGTVKLTATVGGKNVTANNYDFYNLIFNGSGGGWTMTDTNATTTNDFTIIAGSAVLPTGSLDVGSSFTNTGGSFAHSNGEVVLSATSAGKNIRAGGSDFYDLRFAGSGGEWTFLDTNASTTRNYTIETGNVVHPSGTFRIGGSMINLGSFEHATATVMFTSGTTGNNVNAGASEFYNVQFNNASGGWTILQNATSTNDWSLTSAQNFVVSQDVVIDVAGLFTNVVGGANTDWSTTTLRLHSGSKYAINNKTTGGDTYGTLTIGANTDVSSWNSASATTTVDASGSLYSQDHNAIDGDLHIYGDYIRSSGSDYWSYAKDFDGTALGGSSRPVTVSVATSSTITLSGGTLEMIGTAGSTTTVQVIGSGQYAFGVGGGTLNASYFALRDMDFDGLNLSGTPVVSSFSDGDLELAQNDGSTMTVAGSVIDANASLQNYRVRFDYSAGITSGYNVTRTGTPSSAWNFNDGNGALEGEAFDVDGGDICGAIRWDDSTCLIMNQAHYRWRNDDGTEGAPDSEWYDLTLSKRKKIEIINNTANAYTDVQVELDITYDSDMQSDFDDLRFTDSTGTSTINYWRESYISSATTTMWVKVPSLPASDKAIIYMYYGNVSTTTDGSGPNTFLFFDDFEDGDISEYSGDTSLFTVGTSFSYGNGTYGLDASGNETAQTTDGIYRTGGGSTVNQGETIRFFQYVDITGGSEDEPCALFGVQTPGSNNNNYAVCLDVFSTNQVVIAKDVSSNDGSGISMNTTDVTFATGWYEVVIDWLTNNDINVNVYNPTTGGLFASVSTTSSAYTTGGVGYSFWAQHGGWDQMTSRVYVSSAPSLLFGPEQASGGATWKGAEDAVLAGQTSNENIRLRFNVQNSGPLDSGLLYRLQYASKGVALNCESVPAVSYNDVPTDTAGCGTSPACMKTSSNITNNELTTPLLSTPAGMQFTQGALLEDPSNQSASSTLDTNYATEIEYNFQMTGFATANAYCLRSTDGGIDFDNYAKVAEVVMIHAPQVISLSLNGDNDITLTEGATTTISATSTVTDLNGYADLVSATSTFYRSDLGDDCTEDENNCYQITTSDCSFSDCGGNSCVLTCTADMQYFADPTDIGTYSASDWRARVSVYDTTSNVGSGASSGDELLTLFGINVVENVDYGALNVGADTGSINATSTVVNTGNANIDIRLYGTDLAGGASTINVSEQKYSTSTFAYSSCSICQFLTGSASPLEVDLPKVTASTTPTIDEVYWGLNVPTNTGAVVHSGINTFEAIAD